MVCCCTATDSGGIGRFFSRFARRYASRYRRKGLEATQKQLVAGLAAQGFQGRSLLDIGCGVGYLHHELLRLGARSAVGVDLSEAQLAEAREEALRAGLSARTDYRLGDFEDVAADIAPADITLLDKVICCYPDARGLVERAVAHSGALCALTVPRGHVLNRVLARIATGVLWLTRSAYRPFVHEPGMLDVWIRKAGFEKVYEARTPVWLTRIYQRL